MVDTPTFDLLVEEFQALRDEAEAQSLRADQYRDYCESMRPHWAKGYTDDSMAAQAQTTALAQLWDALGVKDQTAAIQRVKKLLDQEPSVDGRRAQTLELYTALGATDHASAMEAARTWVPPKDC